MAIVSASLSTDRTLTARLIEESTLGTPYSVSAEGHGGGIIRVRKQSVHVTTDSRDFDLGWLLAGI